MPQTILITGANRGIGLALTRELRSGVSGRAALLSAIRGRVMGSSVLVGTYRR